MKASGARNGAVQLKTTIFWVSLHEDVVHERRSNPAWQTCLNQPHVPSLAVAPPPGLDMQHVSDNLDQGYSLDLVGFP